MKALIAAVLTFVCSIPVLAQDWHVPVTQKPEDLTTHYVDKFHFRVGLPAPMWFGEGERDENIITYTAFSDEPLRMYQVMIIETDFSKIANPREPMTQLALMNQKPGDKDNLTFKKDEDGNEYVTVSYVKNIKSDDGSSVDWIARRRIVAVPGVNNFYVLTMSQKKDTVLTPNYEDPLLFINSFEITNR